VDKTELITLEQETYTKDALGQLIPGKPEKSTVYCRKDSVSRTEWLSAAQLGKKAAWRVTVWADEYHGEATAVLDGVRYGIYRTYQANADEVELYLEQKVGA
jgi:hypothetical protein